MDSKKTDEEHMTIKLGIAGGNRGGSFERSLAGLEEEIELVAVCDPSDEVLRGWIEKHTGLEAFSNFEDLIESPNIDAVFVATPMPLHAAQSMMALNAGKHVLSEVIAATTLDECYALVETVEQTGMTYMMAENYCYRREAMMIKNMTDSQAFGDVTYAEGAYIHDCRDLMFDSNLARTWRGGSWGASGEAKTHSSRGNGYPTHSLGPIAQWLGINRSDRLTLTTTFVTSSLARRDWALSVLPQGHIDTTEDAWSDFTDSATTLIQTEKGRVICLRKDSASPRPHNMALHSLQGTKGAYISGRHAGEDPLVWINGISTGVSPANFGYKDMARPPELSDARGAEWQSLWELSNEYEHPYWKEYGSEATKAGHGGGDYFIMRDFASAVSGKIDPPIDVYDAVTWSSVFPISMENVNRMGEPLEIPNFRKNR